MRGVILAALLAATPSSGVVMGQYVKGELALRAVNLACPTPPRTVEEAFKASTYISTHYWQLFDVNNDGAVDFEEWREAEFVPFLYYNQRRDGKVLLNEYMNVYLGPPLHRFTVVHPDKDGVEKAFRMLDKGHKGYLDIDDLSSVARATFELNDVNHDGLVTQAEIDQVSRRR